MFSLTGILPQRENANIVGLAAVGCLKLLQETGAQDV
jgi:hypothetical protein